LKAYFDTSCLGALYVPNDHTDAALRYRTRAGRQPILFTPLHRLELRTTVRQCVFGGLIRQIDARQIMRHIEEDLDDGTLIHEPVDWTESLRQADALAERLAWTKPCRSLDLWHVAIAVEIQAGYFVTFDKDQLALADAAGLRSVMPSA
jgi:predicted nucleic acid-binding protein